MNKNNFEKNLKLGLAWLGLAWLGLAWLVTSVISISHNINYNTFFCKSQVFYFKIHKKY